MADEEMKRNRKIMIVEQEDYDGKVMQTVSQIHGSSVEKSFGC